MRSIKYSPDGRLIASCGWDNTIHIWDARSVQLVRVIVGGRGGIAWSPDGRFLASGGPHAVRLWDPTTGQLLKSLSESPTMDSPTSIDWSPDGKLLATASCGSPVRVWEVISGRCLHTLTSCKHFSHAIASLVNWSPDGALLAYVGTDEVRRWDVKSGDHLDNLEHNTVINVDWSPDGKSLVSSACYSGNLPTRTYTVRIWNNETGQLPREFDGRVAGTASLSPDGEVIAVGDGGGTVSLLDTESGRSLRDFSLQSDSPDSFDWSPDGGALTIGTRLGSISTWDVRSGLMVSACIGHPGDLYSVSWAPDCRNLAVGRSQQVCLIDLHSGQHMGTITGNRIGEFIAWSPDGQMVASGHTEVTVWSANSGEKLHVLDFQRGTYALAWSHDGKRLATGDPAKILIWDVQSGRLIHTLEGHRDPVVCLAWSADSKRLASAGNVDSAIMIWNPDSGRLLHQISGTTLARALAWSRDGTILAAGRQDGVICTWDGESGEMIQELRGHQGPIFALGWSNDNTAIFSGSVSGDGTVREWDVRTGQLRRTIQGPECACGSFSPDGRYVAYPNSNREPCRERYVNHSTIWEVWTGKPRGKIVLLRDGRYLGVSADGHYLGQTDIDGELVYIIQTDRGQQTLTREEFSKRYRWRNDPRKVQLVVESKDH